MRGPYRRLFDWEGITPGFLSGLRPYQLPDILHPVEEVEAEVVMLSTSPDGVTLSGETISL